MDHYRSLSHTAWDCKYHLIQKIKSLENAYSKGVSMVLPLQSYRQKNMELSVNFIRRTIRPSGIYRAFH